MKNSIKILTLLFTLSFTAVMALGGGDQTLVVKTSAKCGMCKARLEKDMSLAKGVKTASLNLSDKSMTIVYNTKKTNAKKLKTAISKIGYDADEVIANQKSHDALPGCCRKTSAEHLD